VQDVIASSQSLDQTKAQKRTDRWPDEGRKIKRRFDVNKLWV